MAKRGGLALGPGRVSPPKPAGQGAYGSQALGGDTYLFGSNAEVMNRATNGTTLGSSTNPAAQASRWNQIRPANSAQNANDPSTVLEPSNPGFGANPRRYT